MGYANNSFNVRRGLPKGLITLILTAAIICAAWMPTSALAASIGCGQCHGSAPLSSSPSEQATGHRTGYESTPGYEDQKTPVDPDICNDRGRGLHGIHMNYSSSSYGGNGTNTILGVQYIRHGNCNYCHNKHPHENNFIEISGMSATARQQVSSVGVRFSGAGMGPNGVDMDQMDGAGTCTSACHKGTSPTNPAPWGNYTSVSVRLSCNSCHDDITEMGATLSGMHNKHIVAFGATDNGFCSNCHPDNTGEGRAADDFGSKAYPHASDGTVVKSQNAEVSSSDFTFTPAGAGGTAGTCTFTNGIYCHGDGNTTPPWDGSDLSHSGCAACHNYPTYRNWTGYNGHTVMNDLASGNTHLAATGYNKDTDTYQGVTGPGGKCNMCHSNGTHRSGTIEVVGSGKGYCSGNFTVNQLGSRNANCDNAKCHSGKTTPNWW